MSLEEYTRGIQRSLWSLCVFGIVIYFAFILCFPEALFEYKSNGNDQCSETPDRAFPVSEVVVCCCHNSKADTMHNPRTYNRDPDSGLSSERIRIMLRDRRNHKKYAGSCYCCCKQNKFGCFNVNKNLRKIEGDETNAGSYPESEENE